MLLRVVPTACKTTALLIHPCVVHVFASACCALMSCLFLLLWLLYMVCCRWDYGIGGMVDAAKCLADLQAKGLIKQVRPLHCHVYDHVCGMSCSTVQYRVQRCVCIMRWHLRTLLCMRPCAGAEGMAGCCPH
jgi:hypothetical protein